MMIAALAGLGVLAGGVWSGARWHGEIAALLGDGGERGEHAHAAPGGDAKSLWTCSMHPQVIREEPGQCPICHMELTPIKAEAGIGGTGGVGGASGARPVPGRESAAAGDRVVKYWWDPMMNPPYISANPGKSPMGMDLVPVYEGEGEGSGARVVIDPVVMQNMGVRVVAAREGPVEGRARMVGFLEEAQPMVHEVNLRVSGWVRRLWADTEGMRIEAGDALFDIYSPELQVAIEELISARRARDEAGLESGSAMRETAGALFEAAGRKVWLLGLEQPQVEAMARLERAPGTVTIVSATAGVLTEKPIVEGAAVTVGEKALRIVDYSTLWLDARVFEKDLPLVHEGQMVEARIGSGAAGFASGKIVFVDPRVDATTRTTLVRMAIENPGLALRPGMYATVYSAARLTERAVLVPREAVIDTGERRVVFVSLGGGAFTPREVEVGHVGGAWGGGNEEGGWAQIVRGVSAGERVVVSGQFLLDSESNLREAIRKFLRRKQESTAPSGGPGSDAQGAIDRMFGAYLAISAALGLPETAATRADVGPLAEAAREVASVAGKDGRLGSQAAEIERAAEAMAGHPLGRRREAFKALSEAMIELAQRAAPSPELGEGVVVVNCPMAPGRWMQRGAEVANPYYATTMKSCGEVIGPVHAAGGVAP